MLLPDVIVPTAYSTAMRDRGPNPTDAALIALVLRALDAIGVIRGQRRHALVELVLVGQVVDQPGSKRLFGHERPLVEQRAHFLLGLLSALRRSRAPAARTCRD